jgi:hypothetical protein
MFPKKIIYQRECHRISQYALNDCLLNRGVVNVKFEDHEYSGNIKIDGIGDMVIRLRGTFENESIILNISITPIHIWKVRKNYRLTHSKNDFAAIKNLGCIHFNIKTRLKFSWF